MTDKQITLDKLEAFKNRNKFSYSAWEERGLNPSANEISDKLEILFNKCTDELINAINLSLKTKQLKLILKQNLESLYSSDFDTEEREFICNYFDQLSKIVSVEFKDNLNSWLYGNLLNIIFKVSSFFKGKVKDKEILTQDCTKCGSKLETFITKKEDGIPDYSWKIIQCDNCKEFNLLSTGPNIKELRFGNYKLIEQLPKTEFNEEEAVIRLNQIKVFRKH